MKTIPTNLPGHLIDWYWAEVESELVNAHRVTTAAAKKGIRRFRRALAGRGVGDIQYHADTTVTARDIKTGGYTD